MQTDMQSDMQTPMKKNASSVSAARPRTAALHTIAAAAAMTALIALMSGCARSIQLCVARYAKPSLRMFGDSANWRPCCST